MTIQKKHNVVVRQYANLNQYANNIHMYGDIPSNLDHVSLSDEHY